MKIVPASATIIEDELAKLTLPERIERCGRICYKSEDKIKPGSAEPFCEKVIKRRHDSVLEMATVSMLVRADQETLSGFLALFLLVESVKFLKASIINQDSLLITGSIRTFSDLYHDQQAFDSSAIVRGLYRKIDFMDGHPISRRKGQPLKTYVELDGIAILEESDWESMLISDPLLYAKHRHVAVKFVVKTVIATHITRHRPCSFLQESKRYVKLDSGVTFIEPSAFFERGSNALSDWTEAMQDAEIYYDEFIEEGASPQEARLVLPSSTKTELICYTNLDEWAHIFDQRDSKAADPSMREVMAPLHEEFRQRWPSIFGEKQVPEEGQIGQK
jgi:thymidylate synthase (FAD)